MNTSHNKLEKLASGIETAKVDLAQVAMEYKTIKAEIEQLEAKLLERKLVLEAAAMAAPDFTVQAGVFKIKISQCERENFALKQAVEVMGREALAPFINKTFYTQLRVS